MVQLWVVVSALACPRIFASRYENTGLLQGGVHAANLDATSKRDEYLVTLKQQLVDYAKSGVPAEALPFLETVKDTLENQVLSVIDDERAAHVASHGSLIDVFTTAANEYTGASDGIAGLQGPAATAAKGEHTDCRGLESVDFGERNDAQTEYDADEGNVQNREAAFTCPEANYDWRTSANLELYETQLQHYTSAVTDLIGTRATLNTKIDDLATQKGLCDDLQGVFEEAACVHSIAQSQANNDYTNAYAGAKTNFESQFDSWEEQSRDRELQCRLVNTLICYITALHDHDDQADLQAAADACESGSNAHDCSGVTFTHNATPAAANLVAIPAAPCTAEFDHGAMPEGTSLTDCAVCSGL